MSNISKSRLLATSAIAGLSILQLTPAAQAQDSFGIHNDQPDPLEISVGEGEEVVGGEIGIYADNGPVIVDNQGSIRGNGAFSGAIDSRPGGGIVIAQPGSSITNGGTISGAAHGIVNTLFFSEDEAGEELPPQPLAADTSVINSGTILGEGGSGVGLIGGGSVTNSGLIQGFNNVNGGTYGSGIGVSIIEFADAIAPDATGIGSIVNDEDGTIEGQTFGILLQGGGTIENDGLVRSTGGFNPAAGTTPIGIVMGASEAQEGRSATLDNNGVVLGLLGVVAGGSLDTATINNGGIINGQALGIVGQSTGDLVINNAEDAEIASGGVAITANTSRLVVENDGMIRGDAQTGINILTADAVITNRGTIQGGQFGITTGVFQVGPGVFEGRATGTSVVNEGTIIGESDDGVRLIGGGSVTNSGTIYGQIADYADGISMFAQTDQANEDYSALVTNEEGGDIAAHRFGVILSGGGEVVNAGSIRGGSGGVYIQGTALNSDPNEDRSGLTARVVNSGTIRGDGDLGGSGGDGYGVGFGSDMSTATLENSGTIISDFGAAVSQGSRADLTVTNAEGGTITGATSGIYSFATGTLAVTNAGIIRGEGSYDGFDAAPDAGITITTAASSVTNSGTISGAGAGITTAYQFDEDVNGLVGLAIGTQVENSGTIAGESNDGVRLIGGGSVANSGTITGTGSTLADGVSMYAYNDQANEDYGALVTNEEGGSIAGQRFGIILSGGGAVDNAGEIMGVAGGVFIQGTALNSDPNEDRSGLTASVVNSGTIHGTGDLGGSGGDGYGVGFGSDMSTATLENSGTIVSDFGAAVSQGSRADVTVTNAEGATITGATSGIYSFATGTLAVNNAGTVRGEGTYDGFDAAPDAGITITTAASSVTNSGAISGAGAGITTAYQFDEDVNGLVGLAIGTQVENSGTIAGESNDGVRLIGGGSVANSGAITGTGSALADGVSMFAYDGQDAADFTASVVNSDGGAIGGDRFGVILSGGGSVENAGTIDGTVGGVLIQSGLADPDGLTGIFTNSGTISSAEGAAITAHVQAAVTNSGTLTGGGGVAVQLDAFDDTVTLRTGSAIDGLVDAGEGTDRLTLDGDILELTEAQQLTAAAGFEELQVAAGYWSTAGVVGEFGQVAIDEGAALQVNEVTVGGEADSPILTASVVTNGLLVLNFGDDETVSNLDELTISGSGKLQLIGDAVFTVDTDTVGHTGGTIVSNGGLVLTGLLQGDVVTEGDGSFELGAGGTEGSFEGNIVNDGRFVFNRSDDYDFLGAFSGSGTLDKRGAGTLTFIGDYAFQGVTNIFGGAVRIGGIIDPETEFNLGEGGSLDITGTDQTIGGLAGEGDAQVVLGDSQLTVDQADNSEFAGAISGSGGFVKTGDGTLNLSGDSDYTGPTTVDGGKLAVNGSIVSDVTVNAGGALGGNGSVGTTTINGDGKLTPGNSIGRLTVAGDLTFAAGSIYEVEVNAAGQGDRVDATGTVTIDSGASVAVLAEDGDYNGRTDYVIVTGAGGIDGTFGSVTSDLAFLDPLLRYSTTAVTLSLYRNDVDFADVAIGFNQAGAAAAVQARGIDDPLFEAVVNQNAAGAQTAFGDLSGEILASTISGLTDDSRHLRNALYGLTGPEEASLFVWGSAFGGWGDFDAKAGRFAMDSDHKGFVTGIGYGGKGFAAALSAGIGNSDFRFGGRSDRAKADSKYLAAHLTYGTGAGFRGAAGLAYGWHDVDTVRTIGFTPLAQTLESNRDANTLQLFAEAGYDVKTGSLALTPFARIAHVRTKSDAFAETGGNAALALAQAEQETTFLSLGARARLNADQPGFQPYLSAAWNRASGDRGAAALAGFATGGGSFALLGTLIPKSSAEVEAGFDYSAGNLRIGAAYSGTLASDRSTHGVRITARIAF
ncbi:autotransporter domain-containing protein [Sphingopyxis sp.]|uniref:autotransporter domain-containing protein n=1 Tax=Sphingopyxis sp. TaxID=1908224 RepID=UPI00261A3617|nr:autotransporter domain-containing protein [Sphingopyxis sp.]MCW0198169.1 autotransporter domain-containing protein [Sphingopyxis sp.]